MDLSFSTLDPNYQTLWDSMTINNPDQIISDARQILSFKDRYGQFGSIPWYFIGIIHKREGDCDFSQQLANGDSINERTVNVPAGRPIDGEPPFTWEQCAWDCVKYKSWDQIAEWSLTRLLYEFERNNGFGYRKYHNIYSPYLWSFTNHYQKGKYASDGNFDTELVDQQSGCAPLLKYLTDKTLGIIAP